MFAVSLSLHPHTTNTSLARGGLVRNAQPTEPTLLLHPVSITEPCSTQSSPANLKSKVVVSGKVAAITDNRHSVAQYLVLAIKLH